MKIYIKPTSNYVELRAEESLAGASSGFNVLTSYYHSEPEPESVLFASLTNFWMKILRK